ncbi:MAG: Hsp20/alpha crystallin family protein [Thermodesulfobacteriota bacterium]
MTENQMKLQPQQEVRQEGESTKNVRQFLPAVDIFETSEAVTVLADMPGVCKECVEIGLDDGVLTLKGQMGGEPVEDGRVLLKEFDSGHYLRRFTISESIDQDKITASIVNGVLKLVLPKVAPAAPRRIAVQGG